MSLLDLMLKLPVRGVVSSVDFSDGTSELFMGETLIGQIDTPYAEYVVGALNAIPDFIAEGK